MEEKKREEESAEIKAGGGIRLDVELTQVINYALQQNRIPIIRELSIHNDMEVSLQNITLKIWSEPEIVSPLSQNVDLVEAGAFLPIKNVKLTANGEFLAGLTERISGVLHAELISGEAVCCREDREITALAFDEWHGTAFYPELLTAFVTPNHPEVVKINARAAVLLEKWSGDPSLNAYQTRSPNRVLLQAAAVYGALQAENIVYSVPPASFEAIGQRVRLCDAVIQQKLGTCLDLTLFYASCLEAIGLHPLLLLQKGHIFAGFWLEDMAFAEGVSDDPALITKRLADGINEVAAVECTALVSGKNLSFDDARAAADENLSGEDSLEYIIDVSRARLSGIRPLPQRIATDNGWRIEKEKRPEAELTDAPARMEDAVHVTEGLQARPSGKLLQWERKLLDLGLRNSLINLRLSRNVIPVLSSSLADLEDALADGDEYGISPRPAEWDLREDGKKDMEGLADLGPFRELLRSEFQNKRLRSVLSESELARAIVGLYRASRTSLEENGANTLYLALGLLRWYEGKASEKARYAPIVLLPIEIVRKSANKGYVIRLRDEEPQMNITLLEMLKQDFGITISGLDILAQDEYGVDIRGVFSVLRQAVMDQKRWDVIETAMLGIFSFSQFVMWNDIRSRSEDLKKNKIVRSLIDGKLAWEADPMEIGERVEEGRALLPLPADASQLFAIEAAAKGESFVLHGPPGTGKSQTITTLIANALAQGKTVLFVAEKMAALSVVQRRLSAIGIGPFCLELHSNKSRKRDVLNQLKAATEIAAMEQSGDFERKAEQAEKLRTELDAYPKALHRKRKSGLTVFEMAGRYEDSRLAGESVRFSAEAAASLDSKELERQEILAERLIAAARAVGHPCRHPLSPVSKTVYSQQLRTDLEEMLPSYCTSLEALLASGKELSGLLGRPLPGLCDEWEQLEKIAAELERWFEIPRAWAAFGGLSGAMEEIREMAGHFLTALDRKETLSDQWKEEFLEQDGEGWKKQWADASEKWFLPRLLEQNKLVKAAAPFALSEVRKETLPDAFGMLEKYKNEIELGKALLEKYGDGLGRLYAGDATDWKRIAALSQEAEQSAAALEELTNDTEFRRKYAGLAESFGAVNRFADAFGKMRAARADLYILLEISDSGAAGGGERAEIGAAGGGERAEIGAAGGGERAEIGAAGGEERAESGAAPAWEKPGAGGWIQNQLAMCSAIQAHIFELKEWMIWKNTCREAAACGLGPVILAYEGGLEHEAVLGSYHKALYKALIGSAIDNDPILNTFSGAVFDEQIEQFRRVDEECGKAAGTEIFYRLAARVPSFSREAAHSSEVGILQRAIRSGGRGVSIRRLFEQIPNLLPRLCPCMLMSPISAAQYLDPKREPFDIVVFDEASQMPTCQAVGALARGENAVIVGDPKQMPPTSFFTGNTEDEDNLEQEDLESILDDCLALNLPQTHLLWHYRSRHESLIAFSNSRFYDNKLYTFPSVNDRESKVTLVPVAGFFDRGKTRQNRAEAEAIVLELKRRCHDPGRAGQSVGVVTFNIQQQNLIDDLLTEACKEDASLEAWVVAGEEPLFIKNLENVQGDERDVILFSIGYGPDKTGKVYMNFGPLNREGGWRRLNVAVSRARQEMAVFAAIKAEQIDLSRTCAEGAAALKAFLEFAGGKKLPAGTDKTDGAPSAGMGEEGGIVESLCEMLAENGYAAQSMVGHSKFRIDVGVVDPEKPERYLLGIMLDGPSYGSSKTTRDRELAQISILRGLGWEIHRLWTIDWWDNREKEFSRILSRLKELKKAEALKEAEMAGKAGVEVEKQAEASGRADQAPIRMPEASGSAGQVETNVPADGTKRGENGSEQFENRQTQKSAEQDIQSRKEGEPARTEKTGPRPGKKVAGQALAVRLASYGLQKPETNLGADEAGREEQVCGAKMYQAARFPDRIMTPEDYLLAENTQLLRETIAKVLEVEAPISGNLLTRRVLQSFGISRAGTRLQSRTDELLSRMQIKVTDRDGQKYYWLPNQDPEQYEEFRVAGSGIDRRDARDIPVREAENAVCAVLEEQIGLPEEDLVREAAKLLGYFRTGNIVTAVMEAGIREAVENGRVREDHSGYFTLGK